MPNRLIQETSPYLLQHAYNPVDWYAWKPEAFERARLEDKPILVSIGYATCHWCHVMERESFENPDIALLMNDRFVCIKVDREERPDVDAIYMEACQLMTGGGGWPLNAFMLPDGRPFYAGTYYPPRPAFNRPSWMQLLQHLANLWDTKRQVVLDQAERIVDFLKSNDDVLIKKIGSAPGLSPEVRSVLPPSFPEQAFYRLREQFDRHEGGFGHAPKFPSTMAIQFLLDYSHLSGNAEAKDHARRCLDKMIQGGLYDQIGGGFARYSTDAEWLVPHFEKMLYDNALLVGVLSEAYKLTGEQRYLETVEETLDFVERELTHPDGGFYSALDADSEGVEGKYYVWSAAEIESELGADGGLFSAFYGVKYEGNWEGHNILWRPLSFEAFSEVHQTDLHQMKQTLAAGRRRLLEVRSRRVPPALDDKCLLGWNALMCSAYAAAYAATGRSAWRDAVRRSMRFMERAFITREGARHTWKNGQAQYDAYLDDYAWLIAACIDAYQIDADSHHLERAARLTNLVIDHFSASDHPLFYYTDGRSHNLIVRRKDIYDNATPSGNSTMALNLQRLGLLLNRSDWRERSAAMCAAMRDAAERFPLSFGRWAIACQLSDYGWFEVAVVGDNAREKTDALHKIYAPNKVVACTTTDSAIPLLAGRPGAPDALIYLCREYACQQPMTNLAEYTQNIQT
jgi:uncharacterized protein YyaL (SSP411 family)